MTEEQKQIIGKHAKEKACDGRYFVYCKNIITGEIITAPNMTEMSNKLNLNCSSARSAKSKGRLHINTYLFANSLEELDQLILTKQL